MEKHLREHVPFNAKIEINLNEAGPSFQAAQTSPTTELAKWALKTAWDVEPVDIGVGGSIPFISDLAEVFPEAEILVTGVEDPDTRAHSENASLHLGDWKNAMVAEALLISRLGE